MSDIAKCRHGYDYCQECDNLSVERTSAAQQIADLTQQLEVQTATVQKLRGYIGHQADQLAERTAKVADLVPRLVALIHWYADSEPPPTNEKAIQIKDLLAHAEAVMKELV